MSIYQYISQSDSHVYLLLSSLQVRLQQLGGLWPVPWGSGGAPLGQGLVHLLALVVVLVIRLVVLGVLGKLVILVRLLLELPDLQTPQVDEEEKTGPHRHKQVPLLGLHVCCGGGGGRGGGGGIETGREEEEE